MTNESAPQPAEPQPNQPALNPIQHLDFELPADLRAEAEVVGAARRIQTENWAG